MKLKCFVIVQTPEQKITSIMKVKSNLIQMKEKKRKFKINNFNKIKISKTLFIIVLFYYRNL